MSEYWVARSGHGGEGATRRLHADKECIHLRQARSCRRASPAELDTREVCRTCAGGIDRSGGDWSYQRSLKEAADE